MNTLIRVALVLITLASLGIAIHAQVQLRKARAVVAEDLSGDLSSDTTTTAVGVAPAPMPADAEGVLSLQRQVAALQAERDRLKSDLAAAQSALVSRVQNTVPTR